MFTNADLIHAYTRQQALEDGEQVCLSERFQKECRLYRYPVFCTRAVWELIEEAVNNLQAGNDYAGVVWDIIFMSIMSPGRKKLDQATYKFSVIVQGASQTPERYEDGMPIYHLISQFGATDIDNPNPCITIMFPNQL
jgi:hypothetical protein